MFLEVWGSKMKKIIQLALICLCYFGGVMNTVAAQGDETTQSEEIIIEDEQTPEVASRSSVYLMTFASFTIVVVGLVYYSQQGKLRLFIDRVEENTDGSYTVSMGYKKSWVSMKRKVAKNSSIQVNTGSAVVLKKPKDETILKDGINKNQYVTVINDNSELEWHVDGQKLVVNKKVVEGMKKSTH